MVSIGEVKGVTADLAAKLRERGLKDTDLFLAKVTTAAGRKEVAASLGVDPKAVLELANRADLIRVKGIAGVFNNLLEEAEVETVMERAKRVSVNRLAKIVEINTTRKLARRAPTVDMVTDWGSRPRRFRIPSSTSKTPDVKSE